MCHVPHHPSQVTAIVDLRPCHRGTSSFGSEGVRADYCSRAPAHQWTCVGDDATEVGDHRSSPGCTSVAPLIQGRRRCDRAGIASPADTTSIFSAGQPHAPRTWVNISHCPPAPSSPSLAHVVVRSRGIDSGSPSFDTLGGCDGRHVEGPASPSGERRGAPLPEHHRNGWGCRWPGLVNGD
jgi:hypothetical protein